MATRYDENLILGYVEGELSSADRVKLEAQLAADPSLAQLVHGLISDRAALRALQREAPPADLVEDVLGKVERGMLLGEADTMPYSEPAHVRRFRLSRVLAYSGLAAMLAVSGGLLTYSLTADRLLETTEQYRAANRATPTGDQLADAGQASRGESARTPEPAVPAGDARETDRDPAAPEPNTSAALAMKEGPGVPKGALRSVGEAQADVTADAAATSEAALALAPPSAPAEVEAREGAERSPAAAMAAAVPVQPRIERYRAPLLLRRPETVALREGETATLERQDGARRRDLTPQTVSVQVQVRTRSLGDAKRDVLQWATSNQARIVEAEPKLDTYSGYARERARPRETAMADAVAEAPAATPTRAKVVMRLDQSQVLDLAQFLNGRGQRAGIVTEDAVVRRSGVAAPNRAANAAAAAAPASAAQRSEPAGAATDEARRLEERLAQLSRAVAEGSEAQRQNAAAAGAGDTGTPAPAAATTPLDAIAMEIPAPADGELAALDAQLLADADADWRQVDTRYALPAWPAPVEDETVYYGAPAVTVPVFISQDEEAATP